MANGDTYTDAGEAIVTNLMLAASWWIQSGTGTTTPAKTQTALTTATGSAVSATDTRTTTQSTNDTMQFVGTCSYSGTLAITEVGVFDGSGGSGSANMLQRHVFDVINVVNGDSIEFTIKHQQA